MNSNFGIAIHGGAGVIKLGSLNSSQEIAIRQALFDALKAGIDVLSSNQASQDDNVAMKAVEAAVVYLEECEWFNAGKGAVFTKDGDHELDASIMDGRDRKAGAVGGLRRVRNPIKGARFVMNCSPHVFLVGPKADDFLEEVGLEMVDNSWFDTELRWKQRNEALTGNPIKVTVDPSLNSNSDNNQNSKHKSFNTSIHSSNVEKKFGTVGAVAVDSFGNVAAATSTGGMTNKQYGRIGDSPIIGAGTWADNRTCAVSATGHGELFIRNSVAHDIACRIRYLKEDLQTSCRNVIFGDLLDNHGEGGVVAACPSTKNVALVFNTPGMYRAWFDPSLAQSDPSTFGIRTAIYGDGEEMRN